MHTSKITNGKDYRKIGTVINSLEKIVHLPLVIGADNSGSLTWNIDALFSVRPDCKSHTGSCLTLRHESLLSLFLKQNMKSERKMKKN